MVVDDDGALDILHMHVHILSIRNHRFSFWLASRSLAIRRIYIYIICTLGRGQIHRNQSYNHIWQCSRLRLYTYPVGGCDWRPSGERISQTAKIVLANWIGDRVWGSWKWHSKRLQLNTLYYIPYNITVLCVARCVDVYVIWKWFESAESVLPHRKLSSIIVCLQFMCYQVRIPKNEVFFYEYV